MTRVLCLVVLVCVSECLAMSKDELEDFSNFLLKTSSLDIHVKKGADPDVTFDDDELASDHAWEESGKFEGDLILNDRQRRLIVENVEGLSRNGLTDSTKRWPNNEVIYFIQKEHFSSGQVQAIRDGIDDLGRASCVKFRPYRKGDRDAVVIQGSRRGCFSQVGYQGGYQVLNLSGRHPVGRGCFRHGTVVHEMLHTLGFYHMQSSPDRDDYIDVIWSNIVQPARHNFRKYNSFSVSDFGVGYDYDSVLHYSRRAFSSNGQDTLVPKKNGAEIGQRLGLSDKDTQKLNKMYCDADNDAVQADENTPQKPKNKKKKPKNQPFQGHGIGYHQGKTVVIKLPAAQTYKLPNVPSTRVFDFSKTPQIVSTPEAEGYRFGKEVMYPYKPVFSLNTETIRDYKNSYEVKNTDKLPPAHDDKAASPKEDNGTSSPQHSNDLNEAKPEYVPIDEHDKDLKDAFHRLTKIVKQHVYPQNQGYSHKINKDYSKFYTPLLLKKSDPVQDSLDEKFMQPISYGLTTTTLQKQKDAQQSKLELFENQNNKFKNNQLEDRMDSSYRTSLPTKKPFSSFIRTETPHYATLEYLKNRNDFSNLYKPKSLEDDKHRDKSILTEDDKYKQDYIKINPYDHGFYTDYVKNDSKDRLTDVLKEENTSKEIKPSKYELTERPIDKKVGLKNKQLEDRMDYSYRTLFPTKKPYSAFEQTETPNYATLEYLKNRHDFSSLYTPKTSDNGKRKESYTILGDELPSTEGDWYNKDSYKQNPANYDRNAYSDYIQKDRREQDNGDDKGHLSDTSTYDDDDDDENSRESPKKSRDKYKTGNYGGDDKDHLIDIYDDTENSTESPKESRQKYKTGHYDQNLYDKKKKENDGRISGDSISYEHEDKEESPNEKETKYSGEDYDHGYYTDTENNNYRGHLSNAQNDNDEKDKELPKNNKSEHRAAKYDHDYFNDYDKELSSSNEQNYDSSDDKESPKTQAYTLDGVSLPLTKDWYNRSYSIPGISTDDENSRSNEDGYR